ncbi:hypothetical protein OUZ56_012420 [Daphnia magna]|uniref:Uncharacterized protein n=1 Tax=Daphnia magna TaxID=35525 RepID=A0ABQ9Z2Y9_9CRUS|nr:hypothetical protein OUZ56_012420 [Daphnia magna]
MTLLALLVLETSYGRSLLPPTSVVIQDLDGRPMDDPKAGLKNRTLGCPEYEIIGLRHRMTHRDVENKLPLLDEMVHTLMSRDTDSRIIPREEEAVRAWLASDKIFHIMRDHPAHCLFGYIMGCCWGVKINQDRSRISKAATKMFLTSHLHEYDYDQVLLDEFIWPLAKQNMMAHDSYCCEVFQLSQPFPIHRKDRFFVGSRILMGGGKNDTEELSDLDLCPQYCLPQTVRYLPEWKFC